MEPYYNPFWEKRYGGRKKEREKEKQAGAELCQAQAQVGLPAEAELMLSSMEVPSIFSKLF